MTSRPTELLPGDACPECGHRRDEHDGIGCFFEAGGEPSCECTRQPGLLPGELDEITNG